MQEAKKVLFADSFNFADLFCQMGDPVVVIKKDDARNKKIESFEEIEEMLLSTYDEENTLDLDNIPKNDFNTWQDDKSDRIAIEDALKKLDSSVD